jgi:hypothetical protein
MSKVASALYSFLGAILLCMISIQVAVADKFTVCVGDACPHGAGQANYIWGCDFANANPANPGLAAAKRVCLMEHDNYSNYDFVPYSTNDGGQCGTTWYTAICK